MKRCENTHADPFDRFIRATVDLFAFEAACEKA
jgi:PIN domain nuclease of toxin-antitoxin system